MPRRKLKSAPLLEIDLKDLPDPKPKKKRRGKFKKLPPVTKPFLGCLNCGGGEMKTRNKVITASMRTRIYDVFGGWTIYADDELLYAPPMDLEWNEYPTLMTFENMARKAPQKDWRAKLNLPLRDAEYQRQGKNYWVLVRSGIGFA